MQAQLTSLLLSHAPLTALVGTRVHWLRLPESVSGYPYVNLQVVSGPVTYHSKGVSALEQTRVQADIWADTYTSAEAVARALKDLLSGYRGDLGGVKFRGIFLDGARDGDGETVKGQKYLFRHTMDFKINWKE